MNSNCKHVNTCAQKYVMEMFANLGGRTLGRLPDCDTCNAFTPKQKEESDNDENLF